MEKLKINEIILVEGKDDITALKRVVDAHIISLNGYSGMNKDTINKLVELSKRNQLILFTDPDYAGKMIRQKIAKYIPNVKHVFISRKNATKLNKDKINIGVENANDIEIIKALKNIISIKEIKNNTFTMTDLIENNLTVGNEARKRRELLGDVLKIGYYNAKQLLNSLNSFNISRSEFEEALIKLML